VAELLILAGGIAVVLFFIEGGKVLLLVGLAVVALGVLEVTAREHFSGYRSHTTLLAGVPTVLLGIVLIVSIGSHTTRRTLLLVLVPVFGGLFWLLRRSFLIARQRRVVRR
jgi:hypothetical protein